MMKVILHVTFTTCMSINMSCYGTLSTYISTFKGFRKHTIYLFQFCTYIWLHTYIHTHFIHIFIQEELTFWIQRIISKELVSIFARVHVCAVEHDITYIKNIFCLILSLSLFFVLWTFLLTFVKYLVGKLMNIYSYMVRFFE